mmetsp:Transcript_15430/g.29450  ORF Transcript_15430/g.29450 Transcript_15430/m.29450 type:complete len:213 (-) Transcript_15430:186-824(-)
MHGIFRTQVHRSVASTVASLDDNAFGFDGEGRKALLAVARLRIIARVHTNFDLSIQTGVNVRSRINATSRHGECWFVPDSGPATGGHDIVGICRRVRSGIINTEVVRKLGGSKKRLCSHTIRQRNRMTRRRGSRPWLFRIRSRRSSAHRHWMTFFLRVCFRLNKNRSGIPILPSRHILGLCWLICSFHSLWFIGRHGIFGSIAGWNIAELVE